MGRGKGHHGGRQPQKQPKQETLSCTARERYRLTITRFFTYLYEAADESLLQFYLARVAEYDTISEKRREQLYTLLCVMREHNRKKEQHFWRLPLSAYEGELFFFDSVKGVRNVPVLKKKKRT